MSLKKLLTDIKRTDLLVTPRLSYWLAHNDHVTVAEDSVHRYSQIMVTPPRERSGTFSSSSRGNCLRAQVFGYLGVEQVPEANIELAAIFIDGTWRHIRWQAMLMEAGVLTNVEVGFDLPLFRLKGSLDGDNTDEGWGWELKGMNTYMLSRNLKQGLLPLEKHQLQVASYFLARPDLDRFSIVYDDKNDQRWHEFVIDRDDAPIQEAADELHALNRAVDARQLPEMLDACKGKPDYKCPYRHVCPTASWGRTTEVPRPRRRHAPARRRKG